MKSVLTLSPKKAIAQALTKCREQTLELVAKINHYTLTQQSHPDFSPIGWHLGHIAFTEAYWILEQLAGFPPLYPEYHKLFAADGLPKAERQNLPNLEVLEDYLAVVRAKTLDYLKIAPIETQQRLWWWLIQHESQHSETIAFIEQLHRLNNQEQALIEDRRSNGKKDRDISPLIKSTMVEIPTGEFIMGSNAIEAQDNERPAHTIHLDAYSIDAYPVTCGQYQQFIIAEGYQKPQYWSKQGWQWRQQNSIIQPLYWVDAPQYQNHPVYGVSYYEAEAYANFIGKRLPTEAEWEKAAQLEILPHSDRLKADEGKNRLEERESSSYFLGNHNYLVGHTTPVDAYPQTQTIWGCYDMLGNVWEWTNSWFAGYAGFSSYPYKGYSEVYFDNQHRVLKGGSYVTRPYALRNSFRNWYHPWVREIFVGFRCAKD